MSDNVIIALIFVIGLPFACTPVFLLFVLLKKCSFLIRDPYGIREIEEIARKIEASKKPHYGYPQPITPPPKKP